MEWRNTRLRLFPTLWDLKWDDLGCTSALWNQATSLQVIIFKITQIHTINVLKIIVMNLITVEILATGLYSMDAVKDHASKMWKNMSDELKNAYGEDYFNQVFKNMMDYTTKGVRILLFPYLLILPIPHRKCNCRVLRLNWLSANWPGTGSFMLDPTLDADVPSAQIPAHGVGLED